MSSRALRRAQREIEEKRQLELLERENVSDSEAEDVPELAPVSKTKTSIFAMLGDDDNDEDDENEDVEHTVDAEGEQQVTPLPKPSKKSKKKKKKGKGKAKASEQTETAKPSQDQAGLDEIDRALLALNLASKNKSAANESVAPTIGEEMKQLFSVLSIDTQYLQAANEMRKLFGRAAVQANDDEPRARNRRGQQGGLAAAVAGRNNPGGRNLASMALRRNIFIQGKEEWPRATLGGLGMEAVRERIDGTVEFRFVHHSSYKERQRQFELVVAGMDPERMIALLHHNPYHVSTLLQVSEIAKHQRDNATAGDLLERALFAFGRAVHSTFPSNMSQGRARLDFRYSENREFWLAGWRYIATLGIRATWRTAFEWAKLLISLSPEDDPYCMRLLVDQLALRGREPQALIDLVETDHLERAWKIPPNLAYSVALAHDRLKEPAKARKSLRLAIKEYPWIAARLIKELEIAPIPKLIWGKEPNNDLQELLCRMYITRAKDLWNTTEGTSLLVEVCYSIEESLGAGEEPYWLADINEIDLARHVVLLDDPSLLTLLSPTIKSKVTSTYDPLPPSDSFGPHPDQTNEALQRHLFQSEIAELRQYFERFELDPMPENPNASLLAALEAAGSSMEEFLINTQRLEEIARIHGSRHHPQDEPQDEEDSEDDLMV